MHLWILDADARPIAPTLDRGPIDSALADIVGCVGLPDFGRAAIERLNALLPIDSWSIYRIHPEQPPQMHASGSYRVPDTTESCFRAYRDGGLYRADSSFDSARASSAGAAAVMTHWRAEELAAPHRERIYRQHGMRERLSLIRRDGRDGLFAVNLYRHQHQHPFETGDFHLVQAAARLLLACIDRHLALVERLPPRPADLPGVADDAQAQALQRLCPALTLRERQICERLLRGMTYDGIASDLGLSVPTVKTYRNRAFRRLDIHHRNELFGLVLRAGSR